MRLQTKLGVGTGFLFIVILIFGILGIFSINRLKDDSSQILANNYKTLVYNNNMLKALDKLNADSAALPELETNLKAQENNLTEPGEREGTFIVRNSFERLKSDRSNDSLLTSIRQGIYLINELNQQAILRKNKAAENTASTANTWLMIIFSVLALIAFTIAVNFPRILSGPMHALTEGIRAIVNKDYSKRIHLKQKDEFGELAEAFNTMAEKLDEYENSNLARIKFEKSRIETIINQMKDGIVGLDDKQNILFLNVIAENMTGLKTSAIAGKYAPDVAVSNDLMRTLLQESRKNEELKIYADNKESYFNVDRLDVRNNGAIIGQVIILRNITPFHELNEAKTNFIATVSHELKTPIASIKMSTKLLTDQRSAALSQDQQELVKSINEDTDRLLKITGELLNMAQVETGNIQLKIQPVAPADIAEQALQAVQSVLQQQQVNLKTTIDPELPAINADMEKTSWVLINFITNAIKYSSGVGMELHVYRKEDHVLFTVRDKGKGIEEKYLTRIFDRYFKVPGNHLASGTGLGLAISKEFIEAQSGSIWAESRSGEGSVFGFSFPIV